MTIEGSAELIGGGKVSEYNLSNGSKMKTSVGNLEIELTDRTSPAYGGAVIEIKGLRNLEAIIKGNITEVNQGRDFDDPRLYVCRAAIRRGGSIGVTIDDYYFYLKHSK